MGEFGIKQPQHAHAPHPRVFGISGSGGAIADDPPRKAACGARRLALKRGGVLGIAPSRIAQQTPVVQILVKF